MSSVLVNLRITKRASINEWWSPKTGRLIPQSLLIFIKIRDSAILTT
jgi:hypothetical protein